MKKIVVFIAEMFCALMALLIIPCLLLFIGYVYQ